MGGGLGTSGIGRVLRWGRKDISDAFQLSHLWDIVFLEQTRRARMDERESWVSPVVSL